MYQPFASGARLAAAVACGAVESYLNVSATGLLAFPARSVHEPERETLAASGPPYPAAALHEATPETASVPVKLTESGLRYQPFASGARLAVAIGVGSVASYASAKAPLLVLPARSVQVPGRDAVAESGPL